ncbi:MAG: O-antigen ligase family protein, partial [Staphylococcus equorum]|nr:O-antigen ligase family protein [Staphylococcus equorum]
NFFAVVQSTALMYFWENKSMKLKAKFINCLILILSLFTSGSKTGMVLLVLIFIFKGIPVVFSKNLNKQKLTLITLFVLIFAVLFFFFVTYFTVLLDELSQIIPSFQRVTELFTNFEGAISDSGSTRDLAWGNASQLIKFSPFIGIGIGTYSDLAMFLFGNSTIAHNTYLQLAVEWGMILTVIFIGYLFYHMIAASYHSKGKNTNSKLLRDMLIPFLIGSLSLSLNNARLFWLLFGALVFFTSLKSRNFDNSLE